MCPSIQIWSDKPTLVFTQILIRILMYIRCYNCAHVGTEKTDAEAFCNDTQQGLEQNSPKKRTRVCLYTEKKFFYQNERGEFIHFFVAEIDEYLLLLLLYVLCPILSKHIFIWYWFCCLWTQKCVGGKLLNWFCTAICGTEGVLMHCHWANCFCVTDDQKGKYSKQS